MCNCKLSKVIVAAAAFWCAGSAYAQNAETGFYVGLEVGQSSVDVSRSDLDNSLVSAFESVGVAVLDGSSDLSADDFTYGLVLGYQIFPFLAVEAAYLDLGGFEYKARGTLTDGVSVADGRATIDGSTKGPALSALGILPFADTWSVYARVGVFFSDADYDLAVEAGGESATDSLSDSTAELLWGVGAGFTGGRWTTRLEYQQFVDLGSDDAIGEADVDRIVLGLMFGF